MVTKLIPLMDHVFHYRARYTFVATSVMWSAIKWRPRDPWTEIEADLKLYDEVNKKK